MHQIHGLLLADILMQCAAEVIGNVILTVRECTGAAEAAHDRAALAADAGLDLVSIDGTVPLIQCVTGFKYRNLQPGPALHQLVCGKNTARTGTDDNNIIVHFVVLLE